MKLPDLDPTGGPLHIDQVLLDYDGPHLFTARNQGGALFLALHGPAADQSDAWLYARTSTHRLNQLNQAKISLRQAMTVHARGSVALVEYIGDEPHIELLDPFSVDEQFLPHEDSYFNNGAQLPVLARDSHYLVKPDEFFEMDDLLPVPVEQDLWEFDHRTIQYLKAHMTPLHVVAQRRQRLVADIVLSDHAHRTDFPIPDLGKILISLQKTVDSLGSEDLSPDWKPSASSKRETRLDAVATFPSSFGLRIEAHQGSLADASVAPRAFHRLVDLLSSIADPNVLRTVFRQHRSSTKLHFGQFIENISKTNSSISVMASSGLSTTPLSAFVSSDTLRDLSRQIKELNEEEHEYRYISGRLKAVSLRTKFFLIENDDEALSGRISEQLLPQISGMKIDELYLGKVRVARSVHDLTGEIETKNELTELGTLIEDGRA
jgi:hypothetical protein